MASVSLTATALYVPHYVFNYHRSSWLPFSLSATSMPKRRQLRFSHALSRRTAVRAFSTLTNNGLPRNGSYSVADFMTRKEDLHAVKTTTTVDEALEAIVEKKLSGFPVVDDDWTLVGVVSDYDLLALNSISGGNQSGTNLFPDADSSWKLGIIWIGQNQLLILKAPETFNEMQKLVTKNNGKVVGDLMTPAPLVVYETTNLEDAARLLLDTKYHHLPVVDSDGKLVGMIARDNVVRAALQIKRAS